MTPHPAPTLAAVAGTLAHVKEVLDKCDHAIYLPALGSEKLTEIWTSIYKAEAEISIALKKLELLGFPPSAETPRAGELPKRVRVVKASKPWYWYANEIGAVYGIIGKENTGTLDYILGYRDEKGEEVLDGYIEIADCEPA